MNRTFSCQIPTPHRASGDGGPYARPELTDAARSGRSWRSREPPATARARRLRLSPQVHVGATDTGTHVQAELPDAYYPVYPTGRVGYYGSFDRFSIGRR